VVGGPTSSSHDVETAAARPNIRDSADRNRRSPHRRPIIERRERARRDDAVRGHPRRLSRRSDCRRGSRARVNFRGIRDPSFPPPVFSLAFLFLLSCPLSCELEEGGKRERKSSADTRSAALLLSSINTDCVCGRADSRRSLLENNYTPRRGRSPDNDTARGQDGRGAMKKFDRARAAASVAGLQHPLSIPRDSAVAEGASGVLSANTLSSPSEKCSLHVNEGSRCSVLLHGRRVAAVGSKAKLK